MKPPVEPPVDRTPHADDINWEGAGEASAEWKQESTKADTPKASKANGQRRPNRFRGTNPMPEDDDPGFKLTSIGTLLAEADDDIAYIVEGLMQKGSVNVLAAKPKVGKSTLARALTMAVARGEAFLGCRCPRKGAVWYLAFEGNKRDIKAAFRQLGATEHDAIELFIGRAPESVIARVRKRAIDDQPDLIIIDTMQRFLRAKSTDDYAEMTLLFDHVIDLAQQSNAALLLLTHNSKIEREGLDAILGSTAIAGSVDTAILLSRTDRYRTIKTVQRTGDDLSETILSLDENGRPHLAGSRRLVDQQLLARALYEALEKATHLLKREELLDRVEARRALKLAALRDLVSGNGGNHGNRKVLQTGEGTKSSPYLYGLEECDSRSGFPLKGGNQNIDPPLFTDSLKESAKDSGSRLCTGREPPFEAPSAPEPPSDSDPNGDPDEFF
jgi:hypothetical protein